MRAAGEVDQEYAIPSFAGVRNQRVGLSVGLLVFAWPTDAIS